MGDLRLGAGGEHEGLDQRWDLRLEDVLVPGARVARQAQPGQRPDVEGQRVEHGDVDVEGEGAGLRQAEPAATTATATAFGGGRHHGRRHEPQDGDRHDPTASQSHVSDLHHLIPPHNSLTTIRVHGPAPHAERDRPGDRCKWLIGTLGVPGPVPVLQSS